MKKFRRAKEIEKTEERVPLSARIRVSLKETLEKEAKSGSISLSELIEAVLEDYGRFLKGGR